MKKVSAPSMRCFRTGSSCRDATGPGAWLEAEPVLKEMVCEVGNSEGDKNVKYEK